MESLWSSLTLISEFYDTLGETLATSLVTPTIAFFLSYKVENWLVFYQLGGAEAVVAEVLRSGTTRGQREWPSGARPARMWYVW